MLMENILKKSVLQNLENKLFYLLLVFILVISALNLISNFNFQDSTLEEKISADKCQNFAYSFSKTLNVNGIEVDINSSDIYIFPEIENIFCLGKILLSYSENGELYIVTFTNTKFLNYLLFIYNFSLIIFKYFFGFPKKKFVYIYALFNIFLIINYFHSFNLISVNFITIPLITFYLLRRENNEN